MKYVVTARYSDAELTLHTEHSETMFPFLMEHVEQGAHVDVIDGYTGEVLIAQGCENPYIQDDFSLMLLGWLMTQAWGGVA